MALDDVSGGLRGSVQTAKRVLAREGVPGLYAGLGTVVCGLIPARMLYITTLEKSKSQVETALRPWNVSEPVVAGAASFVGGALASASSAILTTPLDVVSQRQMIEDGKVKGGASSGASPGTSSSAASAAAPSRRRGGPTIRPGGVKMARRILAEEGVRGLYRGVGAALATYVPASAIWWASYGAWQRAIWRAVEAGRDAGESVRDGVERAASEAMAHHHPPYDAVPTRAPPAAHAHARAPPSEGRIVAVQAAAGVLTGFTAATLTNPLDVVRTRLQTAARLDPHAHPSWLAVAGKLAREQGLQGFYRGVVPRMFSSAMWGTAMVSTYEFLKRLCALPDIPDLDAQHS